MHSFNQLKIYHISTYNRFKCKNNFTTIPNQMMDLIYSFINNLFVLTKKNQTATTYNFTSTTAAPQDCL